MALGLAFAQTASAQPPVITNYNDLRAAVNRGGMSIFASNATVTLSGSAETLKVTTAVVLNGATNHDGTTNTATINRASGSGPMFIITNGGSLTGADGPPGSMQGNNNGGNGGDGLSASGGAIFSQGTLEVYYSIFNNNTVI